MKHFPSKVNNQQRKTHKVQVRTCRWHRRSGRCSNKGSMKRDAAWKGKRLEFGPSTTGKRKLPCCWSAFIPWWTTWQWAHTWWHPSTDSRSPSASSCQSDLWRKTKTQQWRWDEPCMCIVTFRQSFPDDSWLSWCFEEMLTHSVTAMSSVAPIPMAM